MSDYPRLKSFNLTEQDFQNLKRVAEDYDVSDSAVIRLGLRKVYEENGLSVTEDSDWYTEEDATDRLADKVATRVLDALRDAQRTTSPEARALALSLADDMERAGFKLKKTDG